METLERVRQTISRHRLATAETRVVAAVSGGSDSVALVHLLRDLDAEGGLRLAAMAHLNHGLRREADDEERFCADLAATLGLPFVAGRADVAAGARRGRRSIESEGHAARHEFLDHARREAEADVVALGHTRDDQAETFLLRLVRGAGPAGLAAMHPRAGAMIRPLLDCTREELRRYLARRQIPFVHDESNEDVRIPRNRIRLELIPLLRQRFNPAIVDVLAHEAVVAREGWVLLNDLCDAAWGGVVRQDGRIWSLSVPALEALPPAVASFLVHRAMTMMAGGRSVGFEQVGKTLALAHAAGGPFDAPGQRVERIGDRVVLTGRPPGSRGRAQRTSVPARRFECPLPIPGQVELKEIGRLVSAEIASPTWLRDIPCTPEVAVVRRDSLATGLIVRNRRPGDRFSPLGLAGRKKLQDFFVDRKIARAERDRVPLVVDEQGRIVWVAGHALAEEFRVTDPVQPVLILRLKAVGGSI